VPGRLILLVATLVLVGASAGCGGGGSGKSAEELVSESVTATSAVKSFHLSIDVENSAPSSKGLNLKFVDGDVLVPDKLKGKVGGTFAGIAISTELIVVGHDYFLKTPFGSSWQKIDVDTLPEAFFDPEKGILAVIQGASGLENDGSEDVGGVDCYRVAGKVEADVLKPLLSTAEGTQELEMEIWIGKDDMLIRRLRLTGPVSPEEGKDAVRNVELSQFDEAVTITAPETS
jgi:lipoprotein LprG